MSIISPTLPTQGDPRGQEEMDVRNALVAILAELNGQLDAANILDGSLGNGELAAAANIALSKLAIAPMTHVRHTADQTLSPAGDGALTVLTWDTERYDTDTIHDTGTNPSRLTCKTAGVYRIWGAFVTDPANAAEDIELAIRLNGATNLISENWSPPRADVRGVAPLYIEYLLAVNDYVELTGKRPVAGNPGLLKATGTAFGMSLISRAA